MRFFISVTLCVLSGCRVEPSAYSSYWKASDLVGTYRLDTPTGDVKTLSLNKDGTLKSNLRLKSGKVYKAAGKWSMNKEASGEQRVSVDEVCLLDNGKQSVCGGTYPLEDVSGTVAIVTDYNQNVSYVRQ